MSNQDDIDSREEFECFPMEISIQVTLSEGKKRSQFHSSEEVCNRMQAIELLRDAFWNQCLRGIFTNDEIQRLLSQMGEAESDEDQDEDDEFRCF